MNERAVANLSGRSPWPRVLNLTASLSVGGTELNALRTGRLLVNQGAEYRTLALTEEAELSASFASLAPLSYAPIRGFGSRWHLQALQVFSKTLDVYRPNVIHCQDAYAAAFMALAPRRINARVVINRRWQSTKYGWLNALNRLAYHRFGVVAVNSAQLRERVASEVGGRPLCYITSNFVDNERFLSPSHDVVQQWMKQKDIPDNAFVVACTARLDSNKRHDLLLRAVHVLRQDRRIPIKLVLAGDGPERVRLESLSSQLSLGNDVLFLGTVNDTAIVNHAANVNCLCSENEGMPNGLVEAAAAGTALVASRVGGIPEIVRAGVTGFLFESGRMDELCAALSRLASDPEMCRRLGENAKMVASSEFSEETYRSQLLAAYGVLNSAKPPLFE